MVRDSVPSAAANQWISNKWFKKKCGDRTVWQLARITFIFLINCIGIGTSSWHILRASKAMECPSFLKWHEHAGAYLEWHKYEDKLILITFYPSYIFWKKKLTCGTMISLLSFFPPTIIPLKVIIVIENKPTNQISASYAI